MVIVFTDCVKCYQLKKPTDIDIKEMSISEDGVMYISDGVTEQQLNMSDLGADSIKADEATVLAEERSDPHRRPLG